MKVYFTSPFFNPEQVERERRLVNMLRQQGFEVYAPSESCILKPDASQAERDQVFQDNINHLKSADVIFAVTDGKDIGTIWEAGFAYGYYEALKDAMKVKAPCHHFTRKYLAYYCETLGDHAFNVMLAKSADYVFTKQEDAEKLAEMIKNGVKQDYVGKIQ